MIQRKQTLWLLLAAICNAGLFFFDIYSATITQDGVASAKHFRVSNHYPLLIISLVITILPFITIFFFKNRKRQIQLAVFNIIANAGFILLFLTRIGHIAKKQPNISGGSYGVGAVLPVVALIFILLAIIGIRKDGKLVRSQDRLR